MSRSAFKRSLSSATAEDGGDADRLSFSFIGMHKLIVANDWPSHRSELGATAPGGRLGEVPDGLESQQQLLTVECFVLLPREGVANVPYRRAADPASTVDAIRGQLELQTGYTLTCSRLLLKGRDVEADPGTCALLLATETLQLSVRHEFQELLDCVEAEDTGSQERVSVWLTSAKAKQSRQLQRPRTSPVGLARTSTVATPSVDSAGRSEAAESEVELLTAVAHSAFVLACCRSKLGLVKLFLQAMPALADARTRRTGRTGLHFACYHEQPRLCRLLLTRMRRGSVALRDRDGNRAADLAGGPSTLSPSTVSPCRRLVLGETARAPAQAIGAADRALSARAVPHPLTTTTAAEAAASTPGPMAHMKLFQMPLPGKETPAPPSIGAAATAAFGRQKQRQL